MSQAQLKSQLRQQLRTKRNSLSVQQVNNNSKTIVAKLRNNPLWQQSQHVGLYLPINNEVDLTALLNADKTCYIPAIQGQEMQFQRHHADLRLITTSFGLMQPAFITDHVAPKLDLCLLPLLGFDNRGHRIGMGGGYYDRYFEHNEDTMLWGVAHAVQQLKQLPIEPWDVKLHSIITEQNWLII